jgi:hypothetical protein
LTLFNSGMMGIHAKSDSNIVSTTQTIGKEKSCNVCALNNLVRFFFNLEAIEAAQYETSGLYHKSFMIVIYIVMTVQSQ